MRRHPAVCLCLVLASVIVPAASVPAQTLSPQPPLELELVRSLNSTSLHTGESLLFTVAEDWRSGACTLPRGSALHAKVLALEPYTAGSHRTSLALQFLTPCDEANRQSLTWISLLAPTVTPDPSTVSMQAIRSSTFGESGGFGKAGNSRDWSVDMSGRQNPNFPAFLQPDPDPKQRRPTQVLPGEVWHLSGLSLHVAAGPEGSSVLSSSRKDLRLPAHSLLILRPARPLELDSASVPPSSAVHPAEFEPAEQLTCSAPKCTVLTGLPSSAPPPHTSIPLQGYGFYRLRAAEMRTLTPSAALAFLGPDQLLVTFDSHRLTPRHPADRRENAPRMVRALVFQPSTGQLLKSENWRIPDDGQYLWPEPNGTAILHQQDRLVWLGADLQETSSLPLHGALAFFVSSPDRLHLATGILHELHSPSEHEDLLANSGRPPEEQVEVQLYARATAADPLHLEGTSLQSSRAPAPVLTDTGQLTLLRGKPGVWHLRLAPWAGSSHLFASFHSSCLPHIVSVAASQLLVTGCETHETQRWFHILRSDGSLLSRGDLSSQQLPPLAQQGLPTDVAFPLALPLASSGWAPSSPFHASEITGEDLLLLRVDSGAPLLSLHLAQPTLTQQPFALDTAHHRLATFDGESVLLLALPPAANASPQLALTPLSPIHNSPPKDDLP